MDTVSPVVALLGVGPGELIFILMLLVLLFGVQKIPDLARAMGRAQREFQRARDEIEKEAAPPASASEEEKLRKAAADLGIPTEGKSVDELRAAIQSRVAPPRP